MTTPTYIIPLLFRFINTIHDYGYWQGKRGRIYEVVTKVRFLLKSYTIML